MSLFSPESKILRYQLFGLSTGPNVSRSILDKIHDKIHGSNDGHPSVPHGQEYGCIELSQDDDGSHQYDELTSTSTSPTTQT